MLYSVHMAAQVMCSIMLRYVLIHECIDNRNDDDPFLLRAIPDWCLEDGREIRVERASTHFGEMSFVVRVAGAYEDRFGSAEA